MEVVQGKSSDKKIVIAQEIAFAKVLAGNNKTLRDRALKKLKKWLTVRGNGRWAFTEDEFIRIWTGLFYCMWMSDKFLVQEELAESISKLIHCFKKNSENALLFVKCFNKRILMEWEGLDQYRIDKFNMLIRRFLRQTFEYCKEKDWDKSILLKLTDIFYNIVLHRDNSLGFVLHFISIFAEELAKVSKGKLENETVLIMFEPFVKLISRTKEPRIMSEAEDFFNHLMRQTDVGIEHEEKFNEWKKLGFPGSGPESLQKVEFENGSAESDEESLMEGENEENEPLDPRAGSVHVFLPQIPFNTDAVINLFKKYEHAKLSTSKGRRKLKLLSQKFSALKKGKFPENIKKDPILDEKTKKRHQTEKNAKRLLEYTKSLDEGPVKSKDLKGLEKELDDQSGDEESDNELEENVNDSEKVDDDEESEDEDDLIDHDIHNEKEEENENENDEETVQKHSFKKIKNDKNNISQKNSKNVEEKLKNTKSFKELNGINPNPTENNEIVQKKKKSRRRRKKKENKDTENHVEENVTPVNKKSEVSEIKVSPKVKEETIKAAKKRLSLITLSPENSKETPKRKEPTVEEIKAKSVKKRDSLNGVISSAEKISPNLKEETLKPTKKRISLITLSSECPKETPNKKEKADEEINSKLIKKRDSLNGVISSDEKITPKRNSGIKRKILSSWQVQELDTSSPDYYTIKTPKIIRMERKLDDSSFLEENQEPKKEEKTEEKSDGKTEKKEKQESTPVFWSKAIAKATKKSRKSDIFVNPFADGNDEGKSPGLRRISFALEKNMAQENAEYLEEVKNSPKVPFDGTRKPIQSALKSGLTPSPINPFYRFKKIKLG